MALESTERALRRDLSDVSARSSTWTLEGAEIAPIFDERLSYADVGLYARVLLANKAGEAVSTQGLVESSASSKYAVTESSKRLQEAGCLEVVKGGFGKSSWRVKTPGQSQYPDNQDTDKTPGQLQYPEYRDTVATTMQNYKTPGQSQYPDNQDTDKTPGQLQYPEYRDTVADLGKRQTVESAGFAGQNDWSPQPSDDGILTPEEIDALMGMDAPYEPPPEPERKQGVKRSWYYVAEEDFAKAEPPEGVLASMPELDALAGGYDEHLLKLTARGYHRRVVDDATFGKCYMKVYMQSRRRGSEVDQRAMCGLLLDAVGSQCSVGRLPNAVEAVLAREPVDGTAAKWFYENADAVAKAAGRGEERVLWT